MKNTIRFVIKYRIFSYQDPKIKNFSVILWNFPNKPNLTSKLIFVFFFGLLEYSSTFCNYICWQIDLVISKRYFIQLSFRSSKLQKYFLAWFFYKFAKIFHHCLSCIQQLLKSGCSRDPCEAGAFSWKFRQIKVHFCLSKDCRKPSFHSPGRIVQRFFESSRSFCKILFI